jgi:peroxiredoxin
VTPAARRRILLAAGAAGCAGLGAWYGWRRFSLTDVPDEATRVLLAQTLPDAAGQPFALSSLHGRTIVLNFWATWCAPCVDEMPELSALQQEIAPKSASVIGIGIDSPSKIRQFAEKSRFAYPLLVGGAAGQELGRLFGNETGALPFTAVIDPAGRVRYRKLGRVSMRRLREAVAEAVGRPAT